MNSIDKVLDTIKRNKLIDKGDRVLVGLSGGADSVALLHMLHTLSPIFNITVLAAHINHNMRDTAGRDMEYSGRLCGSLGIEFFAKSADVMGYAKENALSCEDAGRIIRYEFFDEITEKYNINKIATAHNRNDNAETILMHFIRGSCTGGLTGIPIKRGNIIRPVLRLSRDEIEKYCKENGLEYMTDETNLSAVYTRNKVRLKLIPYIQKSLNRNFINRVTENSDIISDENDFMEEYAKRVFEKSSDGNMINIDCLKREHIAVIRRVLGMYFCRVYNTEKHLESKFTDAAVKLMEKESGKYINLPSGFILRNEYGYLKCMKKSTGNEINAEIITENDIEAKKPSASAVYIKPQYADGLRLRFKKDGDIFYPYGMQGKKTLKKYFSDMKMTKDERENQIILAYNDDVVWIVGKRADRRFTAEIGEKSCKVEVKHNE